MAEIMSLTSSLMTGTPFISELISFIVFSEKWHGQLDKMTCGNKPLISITCFKHLTVRFALDPWHAFALLIRI